MMTRNVEDEVGSPNFYPSESRISGITQVTDSHHLNHHHYKKLPPLVFIRYLKCLCKYLSRVQVPKSLTVPAISCPRSHGTSTRPKTAPVSPAMKLSPKLLLATPKERRKIETPRLLLVYYVAARNRSQTRVDQKYRIKIDSF
jgi:hypothetical protein